ncbi:hypothetical protein LSH36_451g01007 [Paralvinella palmiformis]|uniref:54 kDa nucleoporin n=1 Tax=Paralvinella palmiformis TaxID=53620 RepID=A0AAD9JA67_9ANNE|nr:hypothetical protein LSH36_451g01007 [Paralvinella palmiformis]
MAFSFGAQTKPTFGTTTTTAGTGFSFGTGFGSTAAATTTSGGLFSFSNPAPTATTTSTGLGFGTRLGGIGTGTTTFGTGGSTFGTGGFGTGTSSTFGSTGGFGTTTTASGGLFGSAFGGTGTSSFGSAGTFGTPGTGLFGAGSGPGTGAGTANTGFGGVGLTTAFGTQAAPQQHVQQPVTAQSVSSLARAVSMPTIFGDERDAIIAKWNQLQAFWGTGKGYYSQQGEFINFTADNPFCRFKSVGYSCMPKTKNEDGLVGFIFSKKREEVKSNQQQIVDAMQKLLASSSATLTVCVEDVRALPNDKTEMMLYLQERSPTGTTRRIPASDVYKVVTSNANIKQQLSNLCVENLITKLAFDQEQLQQYLDNPPAGIDNRIWQQARLDNPDPERFIPVPMIGFTELHDRLKQQEQQTGLHQNRLDKIASDMASLQRNHGDMLSKIEECKRRYLDLSHRVLQVMVKQEIYRRMGYVIQADEEQLRTQLETIQAELNAPTRFKGRLNELMSQLRMQNQLGSVKMEASYNMDATVQQEIKQHLKLQQEGIHHLIAVIKDDMEDLKLIEHGMSDINKRKI